MDRKIWVYTPPGYKSKAGPYPLIVNYDGMVFAKMFPRPTSLDNMIARGDIPPVIAVFVNQQKRFWELECNDEFLKYITQDLLPWLKKRYPITSDPAKAVVTGSSMGGLAALYTAFRNPEIFGNVLAQSGAFMGHKRSKSDAYLKDNEWIITQLKKSPLLPIKIYLTAGLLEINVNIFEGNCRIRKVLKKKGYTFYYREYNGTHCYFSRQGTFVEGMSVLFKKVSNSKLVRPL